MFERIWRDDKNIIRMPRQYPKKPRKSLLYQWSSSLKRRLLHHNYTIFKRALMWQSWIGLSLDCGSPIFLTSYTHLVTFPPFLGSTFRNGWSVRTPRGLQSRWLAHPYCGAIPPLWTDGIPSDIDTARFVMTIWSSADIQIYWHGRFLQAYLMK